MIFFYTSICTLMIKIAINCILILNNNDSKYLLYNIPNSILMSLHECYKSIHIMTHNNCYYHGTYII